MSLTSPVIRPARLADLSEIVSFTRSTFSWGDYVPEALGDWQRDPEGRLLVAEIEGRVIACLHCAWMGEGEAWLEGMRVHPERRRQGIARRLIVAGEERACEQGCRTLRLATDEDNTQAQELVTSQSFGLLFRLGFWSRAAAGEQGRAARRADAEQVEALFQHWQATPEFVLTGGLQQVTEWRWGRITLSRLSRMVTQGHICTGRWGYWRAFAGDESYSVGMLAPVAGGVASLVREILEDAAARGGRTLEIESQIDSPFAAAASKLGFTRQGGVLLYAKELG